MLGNFFIVFVVIKFGLKYYWENVYGNAEFIYSLEGIFNEGDM